MKDKRESALVVARSGASPATYWEINDGVFLINLGCELGRQIVKGWHNKFMSVTDAQLSAIEDWNSAHNDQRMVQDVLRDNPSFERAVFHDNNSVINYSGGKFIRQVMRASASSLEARCQRIEAAVQNVLAQAGVVSAGISNRVESQRLFANALITAIYQTILLRDPDQAGLEGSVKVFEKHGDVNFHIERSIKSEEFKRNFTSFCIRYGLPLNTQKDAV